MPGGTVVPSIFFFSPPTAHVLASTRLLPSIRALKPFEASWIPQNVSLDRQNASSAAGRLDYVSDISLSSLTVTISESDIGSSGGASNYRGPMSTYNTYPSYPRGFQGSYAAPSTVMTQPYYASYAPSGTTYSSYSSTPGAYQTTTTGSPTDRTYFSLNGKLVRSYKVRSYRVRLLGHRRSTTPRRDNHLILFFFW